MCFFKKKIDITIQIILTEREYAVENDSQRLRRGDVIAVYDRKQIVEPPSTNRTAFIHVTGVPITSIDQTTSIIRSNDILQKKPYNVDITLLPAKKYTELMTKYEITLPFSSVRSYIKSKIDAQPWQL